MPKLVQHACFSCRKVFKKPTPYPSAVARGAASRTYTCPQCDAPLVNMGHKFRAPPRDEASEWSRIADCLAVGVPYGTPTRRKRSEAPKVASALDKVLGFNTKWKRPPMRQK